MKIYVIDHEGKGHALEAIEGWRVMEIIREHGLPMKAECGGCCACATCHVHVDESWFGRLPEMREDEEDMLDEAFDVNECSRLSCQIIMCAELDGLRLQLVSKG